MSRISKEARRELIQAVATRYREGSKCEKTLILDEFVRITGHHRKHAIRILRSRQHDQMPANPLHIDEYKVKRLARLSSSSGKRPIAFAESA